MWKKTYSFCPFQDNRKERRVPGQLETLLCRRSHSQLDDVWVSEQFKVLDLPFDLPDDIEAADLLPV